MDKQTLLKSDGSAVTVSCHLDRLQELVSNLHGQLEAGDWLFLRGDLGAGKTAFVQKLLESFGSKSVATSPTFSILNVIDIFDKSLSLTKVCHLDLYRLRKSEEMTFLGLEIECTGTTLCVVEWPEMIDASGWHDFFRTTRCRLPARMIEVCITREANENFRLYTFNLRTDFDFESS